ncbi:MAG: sialidase family protein [Pirellulaceae bacterium]
MHKLIMTGMTLMTATTLLAANDQPSLQAIGDPVIIADNAPYCAFTDITRLPSGELLVVYNAGQNHLDGRLRIELRRSKDEGQTWSDPLVLVEPIDSGYGVRDPHIARLRDGRLVLSFFRSPEPSPERRLFVRISDDDGQSWGEPVAVGAAANGVPAQAVGSGKALELTSGRLLLPFYGRENDGEGPGEVCGVAFSDDRGETWHESAAIHREPDFQGMEAEVVELDDNRIVALIRRTRKTHGLRAVSEDGGRTWSEAEEVPVGHAPGILVDGGMMLVNHRAKSDGTPAAGYGRGRKGTLVSLSLDAGNRFAAHLPFGLPYRKASDTAYGGIVRLAGGDYFTTYYNDSGKGVHVFGQRFRVNRIIDLHALPGSEAGHVVKGEGKFPRFAQYEDGTLFVATHRGTHQPGRDNSLQGFVSHDGGQTWGEPREMFHKSGIDPRSPAVGVGPDGVLYAGWRERKWDDPADSRVAFYRSADRGQTWTFVAAVELPDDDRVGHPYGKLLFTDSGEILLCVYTVAKDGQAPMDSRLMVSRDGGESWTQRSIIARRANETSLIRTPNDSLLALVREHKPGKPSSSENVWATRSTDTGRTWDEPVRVTDEREQPAEAIFVDNRTLLCFYGRRHKPFGVRARVSHDGGRTWREDIELVVDDTWTHFDCGYPSAEIVDDGKTLLISWYVNNDKSDHLERDRQCRTLRVDIDALRSRL